LPSNDHIVSALLRKSNQNVIIGFLVTVENVGDAFLGHSVKLKIYAPPLLATVIFRSWKRGLVPFLLEETKNREIFPGENGDFFLEGLCPGRTLFRVILSISTRVFDGCLFCVSVFLCTVGLLVNDVLTAEAE